MEAAWIAEQVERACLLEVRAPKVGNVHPGASFADLRVEDFERAAKAIAPVMGKAPGRPVGETILEATRATVEVNESNTNLGIVLLFAPLCAALIGKRLEAMEVRRVLETLTLADAEKTYEAIRLAMAGGLHRAEEQDVFEPPTVTLLEAMRLAADRDAIAEAYVTGMEELFTFGEPVLVEALMADATMEEALVWCHLRWMAEKPDTLIARKNGPELAWESQRRAKRVVGALTGHVGRFGPVPRREFVNSEPMRRLDDWLRSDGNNRNPGTSADLVAASLLVHLLKSAG